MVVRSCGVCALELLLWMGFECEVFLVEIGYEIVGVVIEVGVDVTVFVLGDEVVVWIVGGGGFVDEIVVDEGLCVKVVFGFVYAVVVEPFLCVVNVVELVELVLGDDVVIVGVGFMGLLTLFVSVLKGLCLIVVVDVCFDVFVCVVAFGVMRVVDMRGESFVDAVVEVMDGRGVDLSYEVIGVQVGFDLVVVAICMLGKFVIVGYH